MSDNPEQASWHLENFETLALAADFLNYARLLPENVHIATTSKVRSSSGYISTTIEASVLYFGIPVARVPRTPYEKQQEGLRQLLVEGKTRPVREFLAEIGTQSSDADAPDSATAREGIQS